MRIFWTVCLGVLAVCCFSTAGADEFFFKDGDTVVMVGDSITEQHLYSNYVEMWTVTRFPQWKLTFRNVGIGGDRSGGGNSRFVRDVLSHKPTSITIDFGMNDGGYGSFNEMLFSRYLEGLQGMASQAQAAGIRCAWITPQPLDTGDPGATALVGYNQTLEKFSDGVRTIAEKNQGLFIDQFHPYLAVLDQARGLGPLYERITAGDAVHPGPPGQALMAASILQGMHFPKLVSSVEIDATAGTLTSASNCHVDELATANGVVSFHRIDAALPFFPSDAVPILKHTPLLEEMNDYRLKITGLAEGKYSIKIGGVAIAEFSEAQLGEGVNLASAALAAGPIAEQVKLVREAVEAKNRYYHDQIFRGIVLTNVPVWVHEIIPREELEAKKSSLISERLSKLPALDEEVRHALEMKARTYEIAPLAQ